MFDNEYGTDIDYEYSEMKCPHCGEEFEVRATIMRGFKDNEDVDCPKCEKFVMRIRADMGYEIIKRK